ncbi:RNA polymerase subunit sigma-54 [Neisseria arctica]|uniref:RNA polymerase sigma-54 factor n=1 Tax=Neisseria arctica TaxID=1470200 RepID=A0A0J1C635_9NEIS|nr:RNA polymerase factor sigma-54 [Neisseria arctica]KLT73808.1 RNA polymerase subunit sigma-54 [Neisseria arctica]UOO87005.1 RNA polymerase factor sigma-54 [Neisseria arctica]
MSSQTFRLKLKQTQQLNQNLQQSLRILQLSGLELEREVDDWLQDNPLLERVEADFQSEPERVSAAPARTNQIGGEEAEDVWATIADEDNFHEYLHKQVSEHPLSAEEAAKVHFLIDFLDEQGYLTDSLTDIIEHTPLEWMSDEEDIQHALDCLQQFDPAGVGASGLAESLLLQLQRLPASSARQCAARITLEYLDDLGGSRQQNVIKLKRELPDDADTIHQALDIIGSLNPFPAYGFSGGEPAGYVQPDVWVKETAEGWTVGSNEQAWPQVRVNQEFYDLLKSSHDVDPVWKEKITEARQKIESLAHRKSTVLRLAEYIVERQADFFIFGEIGLTPMLLKDAAVDLGVAESTVSRAVNHKYLACPRGVFALRYFFTQAVDAGEDNEGTSQSAVKAMLAQLVESENKYKPYSDQALCKMLSQQGIEIARRTVAKYRESMNIAPAHQRKLAR